LSVTHEAFVPIAFLYALVAMVALSARFLRHRNIGVARYFDAITN